MLLIACLLAGLLPVGVNATNDTSAPINEAHIQIDDTLLSAAEGGEDIYAVTDSTGKVSTQGANADNYTIKYQFPAGGVPTLSLRGAHIVGKYHAVAGLRDSVRPVNIVVESDSVITASQQGIVWYNANVTIGGAGTLTIRSVGVGISLEAFSAPGTLTLQKAKLAVYTSLGEAGVRVAGGDIVINGGEVNINCLSRNGMQAVRYQTSGYGSSYAEHKLSGWEKKGNVTVKDSALTVVANTNGIQAEGNLSIAGGTVNVTGSNRAVMAEGNLSVTGGTVALTGKHPARKAVWIGDYKTFSITGGIVEVIGEGGAFSESAVPSMAGHKGYAAYAGTSKEAVSAYNKQMAMEYKYFLLTDGTTVDGDDTDSTPIVPTETTETTEATEPSETTEGTEPIETTEEVRPSATTDPGDAGETEEDGRRGAVLWILILIFVLCAGAAAAIMLIPAKKDEDSTSA